MPTRKKPAHPSPARVRKQSPAQAPSAGGASLVDMAQQLRSWTDSVLGVAGNWLALSIGFNVDFIFGDGKAFFEGPSECFGCRI